MCAGHGHVPGCLRQIEGDITSFMKMHFIRFDIFLINWSVSYYWFTYFCNPVYDTGLMARQGVYDYRTDVKGGGGCCLCGEFCFYEISRTNPIIYTFFF